MGTTSRTSYPRRPWKNWCAGTLKASSFLRARIVWKKMAAARRRWSLVDTPRSYGVATFTFSMNGKKVGKDVECGGKSFEGAGSKSNDYYYGDEESGSAQATAKMMKKKSYPTVPRETIDSEYLPKPSIKGHLPAYKLFLRDERD